MWTRARREALRGCGHDCPVPALGAGEDRIICSSHTVLLSRRGSREGKQIHTGDTRLPRRNKLRVGHDPEKQLRQEAGSDRSRTQSRTPTGRGSTVTPQSGSASSRSTRTGGLWTRMHGGMASPSRGEDEAPALGPVGVAGPTPPTAHLPRGSSSGSLWDWPGRRGPCALSFTAQPDARGKLQGPPAPRR